MMEPKRFSTLFSVEGESDDKERKAMVKQAITKLVKDFHSSLRTTLDRIGESSNAEKHVNELIHKANFRFSDLQLILNRAKDEVFKCFKLADMLLNETESLL